VFVPERAEAVWEECRTSKRGCVQNKRELAEALIQKTEAFRKIRVPSSRARYSEVEEILADGAKRANSVASDTLAQVKKVIGLSK
jgi:tryptophanyl-tRNA synthetase